MTEDLPAQDKERYVAIMVATIILGVLFGSIVKNLSSPSEPPITVSQWGSAGKFNWVMVGKSGFWNYLLSFKWQPKMGNQFAPFTNSHEFQVPPGGQIQWPGGLFGWIKGIFGQRIYVPPPPP